MSAPFTPAELAERALRANDPPWTGASPITSPPMCEQDREELRRLREDAMRWHATVCAQAARLAEAVELSTEERHALLVQLNPDDLTREAEQRRRCAQRAEELGMPRVAASELQDAAHLECLRGIAERLSGPTQ